MKSRAAIIAMALVAALALPTAVSATDTAAASTPTTVDRLGAVDRFAAAVALSRAGFPKRAKVVYVASGSSPTDALLAAPAAAHSSAPVLLSNAKTLPAATKREIARLHPARIVIVGSVSVIGSGVANTLKWLATNVTRVAGSSTEALSRNLTRQAFPHRTSSAYVTTASVFAEVLVASAAAARANAPLVIVARGTALDRSTRALLISHHVKRVSLVGDDTAIPATAQRSLAKLATVKRVVGATPEQLSLAASSGKSAKRVLFANGAADAAVLALPAAAARLRSPVYIVGQACVDPVVLASLTARGSSRVTLVGSTSSLGSGIAALEACEPAVVTPASATPTPGDTTPTPTATPSETPTPTPTLSGTPTPTATPDPNALPAISTARLRFGVVNDGGPAASANLDATSRLVGESPSLLEFYEDFTRPAPIAKLDAAVARGATPVITWEPRSWNLADDKQQAYRLDRITAGDFDAYLTQYAKDLAAWGKPVMLRFGHEMNGDWYPWSELENGNSSGDYVAAWKHVHDIFTFVGATNVQWVWSPNAPTGMPIALLPLYPGSSYVDIVALDSYNWGTTATWSSWQQPAWMFAAGLTQLRILAPGKPILIAETASTELGGSKPTWIGQLVAYLDAQPDVDGLIWFDLNKETDWRIDSSDASAAAFATALAARNSDN